MYYTLGEIFLFFCYHSQLREKNTNEGVSPKTVITNITIWPLLDKKYLSTRRKCKKCTTLVVGQLVPPVLSSLTIFYESKEFIEQIHNKLLFLQCCS